MEEGRKVVLGLGGGVKGRVGSTVSGKNSRAVKNIFAHQEFTDSMVRDLRRGITGQVYSDLGEITSTNGFTCVVVVVIKNIEG